MWSWKVPHGHGAAKPITTPEACALEPGSCSKRKHRNEKPTSYGQGGPCLLAATRESPRFSLVQWLSHVRLFATPRTAAHQPSLSFSISWSLPKLTSIELVMPCNHLTSVILFSSCLQSFPASGSFPTTQFNETALTKQRRPEQQKKKKSH